MLKLSFFIPYLCYQGGGRSSARETIGRVASGAIAKKILKELSGTEVPSFSAPLNFFALDGTMVIQNLDTFALFFCFYFYVAL